MKRRGVLVIVLCILAIMMTGCGNGNSWKEKAQSGKFLQNENDTYPCIAVSYWDIFDEFGDPKQDVWITVSADRYNRMEYYGDAEQLDDGKYVLKSGEGWAYYVGFDGAGKAKVELEEDDDGTFVLAKKIAKSKYKKAAGTYKVFIPSNSTGNETLEQLYDSLYE